MINKNEQKAYLKEHLEFLSKYPQEVGSKIFEFEEEFKKYFKVKYASACVN
jgi:dTDP-4-amino-4,6-dideoxygalactose transaminase